MVTTIGTERVTTRGKLGSRFGNLHAFAAAWLGETFDAMDAMIYFIVLFPALSDLLKTTDASTVGWYGSMILAIFMVGWAVGSVGFGILADKVGRRKAMTLSILLYALGSGLCALSQSWGELAFYRFLVGCGIGGEISLGCVLLSEAWQGKGRVAALCLMQSSFGVGCLLSGAFTLGLGEGAWRGLFLIGIVPALVAFYIRSQLTEPQAFNLVKEHRKRLAQRSAAELSESEKELIQNPITPLMKGENLKNLILATVISASAIVGYWAAISWMPAWINQITGTEAVSERGTATMALSIGGILICFVCPYLNDVMGRKNLLVLGFVGSLVSVLAMFLGIHSYGNALLAAAFAVGVFSAIPFVVISYVIPEMFATHVLGTASGISWSVGRLTAALAGILTAPLIAFFGGSYGIAASCVSSIYVLGIVASLLVKDTSRNCLLDVSKRESVQTCN